MCFLIISAKKYHVNSMSSGAMQNYHKFLRFFPPYGKEKQELVYENLAMSVVIQFQ